MYILHMPVLDYKMITKSTFQCFCSTTHLLSQHAAMAEGTKHYSHFPRWITLTFILVDNKYIKSM